MKKKVFAALMVMSLLIIGSLLYAPGIFAHDADPIWSSQGGVRFFRIEDASTSGGATAPNVGELVDGAVVDVNRSADGISMKLVTSGLPKGAYSVWWVIDNDNDDTTGASPGLPLVKGVEIALNATGGIVGDDGEGKFEATLAAGPIPPRNGANVVVNWDPVNMTPGGGSQVLDPFLSRIGIVIRYHGPVIPGAVNDQMSVFAGGCSNSSISGLAGALPGGNSCFDPQQTEFHVPRDDFPQNVVPQVTLEKSRVVFFRVADSDTPGGTPAPNVGLLIPGATFELERTADGVSMVLVASGLPEGPYTIWWAIDNDNDPGSGASPGDDLIVGVEAVRLATGGIVGANGIGEFAATLLSGPIPPANGATVMLNIANKDFDPMGAGIALVIRSHGPVMPGAVNEQTTLFAGGCTNTVISGLPGAFPGGNVCFDPQATQFDRP